MRIQPITEHGYYNRTKSVSCQKTNLKTNSTAFKGHYEDVMWDVLKRDLTSRVDVEKAMSELFFAITKENGYTKAPLYDSLWDWVAVKGTYLVEELCKPIAKVRSDFRDIIFQTQDNNLSIVEKDEDSLIYIINFGKHGFWNSVFDNEAATNDMRVVFTSKDGTFEVGTDKKGKLVSEQSWRTGYWKKNTYNWFCGDRISQKTGDASETIIIPPF